MVKKSPVIMKKNPVMVKKFLIPAIILILTSTLVLTASALSGTFRIEQAQAEMPYVHAWLIAEDGAFAEDEDFTNTNLSARLNNAPLTLTELRPYDPAIDATAYYFIVDVSTSITNAHVTAIKNCLNGFAENMGVNDTITLITFGVTVDVLLNRETDIDVINEAVSSIVANQRGTLFFEGLNKAQELAGRGTFALERKIAFVFSDADDFAVGSHTRDEVINLTETGNLPFYALGFNNGSKAGLDFFGERARASGGEIRIVSAATTLAAFNEMLEISNSAWLALFKAESNITSASSKELIISEGNTGISVTRTIPTAFWQPDNDPLVVLSAEQLTAESIQLKFSKPVSGGASTESYTVTDENGNLLGIRAAAFDETDNSVVLTFLEPPQSGTLTATFPGLTDISMERNKVEGSAEIKFTGTSGQGTDGEPGTPGQDIPGQGTGDTPGTGTQEEPDSILIWVIVGVVGVGVVAAIAFGANAKKKSSDAAQMSADGAAQRLTINQGSASADEMQVHFAGGAVEPPKKIKLNVTDSAGKSHVVEIPVNKTLFVGRSDICDVFFDDKTMSRQHFVISEDDSLFTISNLSETGSTFLNGVPVKQPRALQNGDSIQAGQQTIVFFIL